MLLPGEVLQVRVQVQVSVLLDQGEFGGGEFHRRRADGASLVASSLPARSPFH